MIVFAPEAMFDMRSEGTAIGNGNLLVLLRTRREHLRERMADAIQAGPPQPDPTATPRTP